MSERLDLAHQDRRARGERLAEERCIQLANALCDALELDVSVPNYKMVGPDKRKKLSGLINHYRKMAKPFTACVPPGTLIETQSGPRPICELGAGDRVWSRSEAGEFELDQVAWSAVTRRHARLACAVLGDGTRIIATPDHRVMLATCEWAELGSLNNGDLLLSSPSFSFTLAPLAVSPPVGSSSCVFDPQMTGGASEPGPSDSVLDDLVLSERLADLRRPSVGHQRQERFHDRDTGVSVDSPSPGSVATLVDPMVHQADVVEDGSEFVEGLSIFLDGRHDQRSVLSSASVPVPAEAPFSLHEARGPREVQSVEMLPVRLDVWDIEVAHNHNFISSGVVFHNCVKDNTQRFGPDRAKKVCAVLTDLEKGTTKWRSGGKKASMSLAEVTQPHIDDDLFSLLSAIGTTDYRAVLGLDDTKETTS